VKACIVLVTALALFGSSPKLAKTHHQSDTQSFVLHFPRTIDPTSLSIRYFLTGSFGGYGGFVNAKPDTWEYAIETSHNDKPARTLKAIVFCPGYEMKLLDFSSLDDSSRRNADIELRPLGSIQLSGKVMLPKRHGTRGLRLEATYEAYWGHEFFGIIDGMVSSFVVASSDVSEDGSFSMMVPDFAHDSTVNSFKEKGEITLTAREPKTHNIRDSLETVSEPGRSVHIQLADDYSELILYARPSR